MKVNQQHYRTIWVSENDEELVQVIDQRQLPHAFVIEDWRTVDDAARAIKDMHVRGAGLIGAAAGYGMYLAALQAAKSTDNDDAFNGKIREAAAMLKRTRPTAVNLEWALNQQMQVIAEADGIIDKVWAAFRKAQQIADEDVEACQRIGENGLRLLEQIHHQKPGQVINVLTHCNAGWLAFVDYGTATAPLYAAHEKGIRLHVWVDETRPRNQGARLTAWELGQHGIPHTIITDNAGGHLMQHGQVDMVITGADRVTRTGDAANKIGTYLKALAAADNDVPFYVALPSSTFDWSMRDGLHDIPIEQRNADEVKTIYGLNSDGEIEQVLLTPQDSPAANYGFDVTPSRLIAGLITERGICQASEEDILRLYPEQAAVPQ